jgi:signal transduction histidine kinase
MGVLMLLPLLCSPEWAKAMSPDNTAPSPAADTAATTAVPSTTTLNDEDLSYIDSLERALLAIPDAEKAEKARTERRLGYAYSDEYRYHEALEHFNQALTYTRMAGSTQEVFEALTAIGYTYYTMYDYAQALPYYNLALALADADRNDSLRAVAYDWMSLQYLYSDAYGQAISHQLESIKLREELHDRFGLAESYYSMGDILGHQKKLEESKAYFRQCIRLATEFSQDHLLVGAYGTVGQHFIDEQNWDSAYWYAQVALEIAEVEGMDYGLAFCNSILGDCHRERGVLDSAAIHYHKALEVARIMQDPEQIAVALIGLGQLAVLEHREQESISRFRQALALAVAYDLRKVQEDAHQWLAKGFAHFGEYDSAYRYSEELLAVKDSLHRERAESMVSTLEARYGILQSESEQQAALLAKDRALQRMTSISMAGIAAFVLVLALILWRHNRKQKTLNAELAKGNALQQQQNIELTQVNEDLKQFAYAASHDLKQPLKTIGNFTGLLKRKLGDPLPPDIEELIAYIEQANGDMQELLTSLLHYTQLENKADSYEDLDLNRILQSVQLGLTNLIQEKDANVLSAHLPQLRANREHMRQLFQNLINNGLKFNDKRNPEVIVDYEDLGNMYRFSVHDNGIGIRAEDARKIFALFQRVGEREDMGGTGMGLSIAKRIVSQLGGEIWVDSQPGLGSTFYFTVPLTVPVSDPTESKHRPEGLRRAA